MALQEFPLPIQGFSEGVGVGDTPQQFSGYLNNVRPLDTLERRLRLGQRPGLDKKYSQQIAGLSGPIVAIGSVSYVEVA